MKFNTSICIVTLCACAIICKCSCLSGKLCGHVLSGKNKIWVLAYKCEVIQFCTTQIRAAMLSFRCIYSNWCSALDTKCLRRRKEISLIHGFNCNQLFTVQRNIYNWKSPGNIWRVNMLFFTWGSFGDDSFAVSGCDVSMSRVRPWDFSKTVVPEAAEQKRIPPDCSLPSCRQPLSGS